MRVEKVTIELIFSTGVGRLTLWTGSVGKQVGFLKWKETAGQLVVEVLNIKPAYRKRGFARTMLATLEASYRQKAIPDELTPMGASFWSALGRDPEPYV